MKTIKLLSNEKNNLVRVLEKHKKYLQEDNTITSKLKEIELENLEVLIRRANGEEPKECVFVMKNVDVSVFGLVGEDDVSRL